MIYNYISRYLIVLYIVIYNYISRYLIVLYIVIYKLYISRYLIVLYIVIYNYISRYLIVLYIVIYKLYISRYLIVLFIVIYKLYIALFNRLNAIDAFMRHAHAPSKRGRRINASIQLQQEISLAPAIHRLQHVEQPADPLPSDVSLQ